MELDVSICGCQMSGKREAVKERVLVVILSLANISIGKGRVPFMQHLQLKTINYKTVNYKSSPGGILFASGYHRVCWWVHSPPVVTTEFAGGYTELDSKERQRP